MIYIRHYFPGVNLDEISDEDFAMLSEDALWLHQELLISKAANSILAPNNINT